MKNAGGGEWCASTTVYFHPLSRLQLRSLCLSSAPLFQRAEREERKQVVGLTTHVFNLQSVKLCCCYKTFLLHSICDSFGSRPRSVWLCAAVQILWGRRYLLT